jgi:hypothetical protein
MGNIIALRKKQSVITPGPATIEHATSSHQLACHHLQRVKRMSLNKLTTARQTRLYETSTAEHHVYSITQHRLE